MYRLVAFETQCTVAIEHACKFEYGLEEDGEGSQEDYYRASLAFPLKSYCKFVLIELVWSCAENGL